MEDAYFLKPGFDDTALNLCPHRTSTAAQGTGRGLAYMEETGYYVYLDPDDAKNDDVEVSSVSVYTYVVCTCLNIQSPSEDVCGLNVAIGKPALCAQQSIKCQPLKMSQSLGNFNTKGRSSYNSLPLKFRALKPGKMVRDSNMFCVSLVESRAVL